MNESNMKSRLMLILSMTIFGTIGIFRKYIPIGSAALAMFRGFIGVVSLLIIMFFLKQKVSVKNIRKNLFLLILSGAMIGFNWILLFEAYNYTTVAVATLCYYMSPIFVILASPIVFGEKLSTKKLGCVAIAMAGMVLISGVLNGGTGQGNYKGVLLGLGAAVLYASVVIVNKKIKDISAYDKTITQLGSAAIVLLPYVLLVEGGSGVTVTVSLTALILFVGVVHTGLAYVLYFASLEHLPAQTVAIFGYIDPVIAVLLSALILREPIGILEMIGMVLILGGTFLSEKM